MADDDDTKAREGETPEEYIARQRQSLDVEAAEDAPDAAAAAVVASQKTKNTGALARAQQAGGGRISKLTKSLSNGLQRITRSTKGSPPSSLTSMGSSGSQVGFAKARVRRLSLASSKVEKLDSEAKAAIRESALLSSRVSQDLASSDGGAAVAAADHEAAEPQYAADGREPVINSAADVYKWVAWAKSEAEVHVQLVHPRIKIVKGREKKRGSGRRSGNGKSWFMDHAARRFTSRRGTRRGTREVDVAGSPAAGSSGSLAPQLNRNSSAESDGGSARFDSIVTKRLAICSSGEDVSVALGVGVRLYFELSNMLIGMSVLGVLCMIPSYVASLQHLDDGAYAGMSIEMMGIPGFTAMMSLGIHAAGLQPASWAHPLSLFLAPCARSLRSLPALAPCARCSLLATCPLLPALAALTRRLF